MTFKNKNIIGLHVFVRKIMLYSLSFPYKAFVSMILHNMNLSI
uniref:Uncharacterized protein n=1 Tax=Meloidogyne enterolobii TaxID=390850 RepID=A0A6V7X4K9_MELEN|nr:unnamed protein product [Meloidogyne enterolobii]